ncbi:MAG: acyl-CoA dehydrogenase family protein, partial [Chloroflexi bacterium]|nr:acyl-CoA dehydrogenase family protein [Chloroflexota bacterium]
MEFGFTEEQEKLRKEIHEFFISELPSDFDPTYQSPNKETQEFYRQLIEKAVAKGYYVPGWPKEYGGSGYTDIEQGILGEVMGYFGVAWPDGNGLHMLAPALILIGTEEQKKRFLP